ncbi:uncharacterized protein B0H18DRAFT_1123797 [Fomitopsis serialis]|uniref:uncharacterized protein n=1 Tax=Fomitopsis serialis TaxID=139415 RepID=UPI00200861FA|nr:uncharacterized protein B0H18DRAFT_1123797 [Neoantrodia serialis]KAH9917205.1 hypothetical protein B0H18DRAFT_1123797 [Neoantrodia serialis]
MTQVTEAPREAAEAPREAAETPREAAEAPRDTDISSYSVALTGFVPSANPCYARINLEVLATIRPFIDIGLTGATFLSVSTTSFSPEFRRFIFCFNWGSLSPGPRWRQFCPFWNGLMDRAARYIQHYPEKFQGAKEAYLVRLVTTTSWVITLYVRKEVEGRDVSCLVNPVLAHMPL